ncbi:Hypothetical_protein [Hexamita inflata]|uniref:Hypothetical_protein n=1 Tax=Hexamita inflata TaxID=28002 RepID=A0AA86Q3X4_9EUKA|nr:Hypothetical protein HINF_LOCUS36923 [Hexamita inflata]
MNKSTNSKIEVKRDMKLIFVVLFSIYFCYCKVLFSSFKNNVIEQFVLVRIWFIIFNQISLITINIAVLAVCGESTIVRTFSLTCIICFYFYSRVLIGSTFDLISKSEQRSLIYGETLMMLVYLYRNIKYVLFLSKLTLENVL